MYYNEYDEDFWKALDNLIDNSEIVIDRPKVLCIQSILILFIKLIMAI